MSKEAKTMLVISFLFSLAMGLSNIFVNIFLWKKSNNFVIVAQYNLMHYIFLPLTFIVAGWLTKKKNGVWSLRLGIFFFLVFFSLILYIKDSIIYYKYPLGILFGIAAGFYWLAYHVLTFDFTSTGDRDSFNGKNGCINASSSAAAPLVGAYIIEKTGNARGYGYVFMCSMILFVILILVSMALHSKNYGSRLELGHIFGSRHSDWSWLRKAIASWGLRDVVVGFLISVLIFKSTGSEFSVGQLTTTAALISSTAFFIEQKLVKPKKRLLSMHIGAIMMLVSVLGLVWQINYMTLFIFIILDACFMPFFTVHLSSAGFNVINEYHEENLRVEYIINKEIILNIGRMVSTLILISLLCFVKYTNILNYFLLFLGSAQLISLYFLRKLKIWKMS